MKKILAIVLLAAIIPATTLLGQRNNSYTSVTGSGAMVTQQCKLKSSFDKIQVSSGITLNLSNSAEQNVTITCKESIQPYVETLLDGSTLVIRIKPNTRITNSGGITADVSVSQLKSLVASGGSKINLGGTFATKTSLSIVASGGARITGNISCGDFALTLSGGGVMSGNIESSAATMTLSGGSRHAGNINAAGNVKIVASGGAPIAGEIYCRDLNIVCSGGSSIKYTGKCADMNVVASGGGRISCAGLTAANVKAVCSGGGHAEFTTTGSHNIQASGGGGYIVKNAAGEVVARK